MRLTACAVLGATVCWAADKSGFEGVVTATLTRAGTQPTQQFVFVRKGQQLRIENTSNKLEPINVIDLAGNKLTIIYPHNTSFVHVDLTKLQQGPRAGPPGMPPMPGGLPQPGSLGPGLTPPATNPGEIGPNVANLPSPPAGFPAPPPMSSIPPMPNISQPVPSSSPAATAPNLKPSPSAVFPTPGGFSQPGSTIPAMPSLPPGVGPGAGMPSMPMPPSQGLGRPGMPPMPMPAMGGMFGSPELKKGDKTKKIQGFEAALFTVSSRGENFEMWATNDSVLFPFRLITRDYIGRRFGPQMLEAEWPEMLRAKSLFPLEATLKMEPGGQERLTFKIDKIEKKKIEDDKLFQPPEKYIEIQAPGL